MGYLYKVLEEKKSVDVGKFFQVQKVLRFCHRFVIAFFKVEDYNEKTFDIRLTDKPGGK